MRKRQGIHRSGSNAVKRAISSAKTLEKRRKKVPRRLVHEPTVGVELLVRVSDEDLRLQE